LPHDGVPDVRVIGLRKSYGDVVAVDKIDLDIGPGEFHHARAFGLREDHAAPTRGRHSGT